MPRVMQSIPIVSSLKLPSSFSKPQVIDPSGFSSRYFLKICATGFFGLSSEWCGFWCGRCSSKFWARGLWAWGCWWLRCCCCCGWAGRGLSTLNRWAFDGTSCWNCSCCSNRGREGACACCCCCCGGYSSSGSSETGLASSKKRASVIAGWGLCGFLTRIAWFGRARIPCCALRTGSTIAPGICWRAGTGPSNCARVVARQQNLRQKKKGKDC